MVKKNKTADKEAEANDKEVQEHQDHKKMSKKELQAEVETLSTELTELKDKYLRIFAEFDNYKKRNIRERMELMNSASQDVVKSLLPILDDFDRAKLSAEDETTDETISDGVLLVYNKLHSVLKQKGLKGMESNNEVFDPELHEAISELPASDESSKGKIIDTVEKGYYLNDKIIRFAKVVVGK